MDFQEFGEIIGFPEKSFHLFFVYFLSSWNWTFSEFREFGHFSLGFFLSFFLSFFLFRFRISLAEQLQSVFGLGGVQQPGNIELPKWNSIQSKYTIKYRLFFDWSANQIRA